MKKKATYKTFPRKTQKSPTTFLVNGINPFRATGRLNRAKILKLTA